MACINPISKLKTIIQHDPREGILEKLIE